MEENKRTNRDRQRERTARTILAAAREVFENEGFEAANIRKIARTAGVSPGSVIHYYKDKISLLHEALYQDLVERIKKIPGLLKRGSFRDWLNAVAGEVFAYYQARPALSRVLLKESLFASEPWAARFNSQTNFVYQYIVESCEQAKADGELHPTADSSLFALSFLSFFYFALIAWVQGAHGDPRGLVEQLLGQYCHFLKGEIKDG